MFDLFIGKAPTNNRQMDPDPLPIQKQIRELLRLARNRPRDRRKNNVERRNRRDQDVIVNLSSHPERRYNVDRRQKHEFLIKNPVEAEHRKQKIDRRRSVREGILVSLSTKKERRSPFDRRH